MLHTELLVICCKAIEVQGPHLPATVIACCSLPQPESPLFPDGVPSRAKPFLLNCPPDPLAQTQACILALSHTLVLGHLMVPHGVSSSRAHQNSTTSQMPSRFNFLLGSQHICVWQDTNIQSSAAGETFLRRSQRGGAGRKSRGVVLGEEEWDHARSCKLGRSVWISFQSLM